MNSKFYVSLEAEELLKEKGYPFVWGYDSIHPRKVTKAEAIDWLEENGMLVWAEPTYEDIWMWFIISPLHFEDNTETNNISYPTRLEAEDAAIIKALELL